MAHPDDAEFTCAGTVAKRVAAGWEVRYVLCTSGDKGSHDLTATPAQIAAIREDEQRRAAQVLGVAECIFLRHRDGELEVTMDFRRMLSLVLRQYRPSVVFTHDPWRHYTIHPDHRAVGFSVLDAIAACRDHLYFPEQLLGGLKPHRVKEVYLFGAESPNHWEDISGTFDKKMAALAEHQSQVKIDDEARERIRRWAEGLGQPEGIPLAEAFRLMRLE